MNINLTEYGDCIVIRGTYRVTGNLSVLITDLENRIIASYRDAEFYDGDRNNGYGGYIDDGRWNHIAKNMIYRYKLNIYEIMSDIKIINTYKTIIN